MRSIKNPENNSQPSDEDDKRPENSSQPSDEDDKRSENSSPVSDEDDRTGKDADMQITENSKKVKIKDGLKRDACFYIMEITDDIFARIKGKSYKDDCTVPRKDLRYLHLLYKDLKGKTHEGEMIVNYRIAKDVMEIFEDLYKADYPIEKIRLIDEYVADDELSMEDNNSSAFNFRLVSHTSQVSKHGLGLAVDINPLYNPYTKIVDGERIIEPVTGGKYLDRSKDFPYKIDENDLAYKLFTEKGFFWGGHFEGRKDYQHFEIPVSTIRQWYPDY